MATIENLSLEISEAGKSAAALVTYTLSGSDKDIEERRRYREVVELIGVDKVFGEDGVDEPIPGVRLDDVASFSSPKIDRSRLLALPSASIDEDTATIPSPLGPLPSRDELVARVTLTQIPPKAVSAVSPTVYRGGQQVYRGFPL